MEFEEVIPIRPLYKFLPLAPDLKPTWQERLSQILSGRLYFSSPEDFNDPFDCLPYFAFPSELKEFDQHRDAFTQRLVESGEALGYGADASLETVRWGLETLSLDKLAELLNTSTRGTASRLGVYCLAEAIDSVLMWGHYASNHRGIALRFNLLRQPRGGLMPAFKVKYESKRPIVTDFVAGLKTSQLTDALRVKADFWSYEREWRSFIPNGARTLVDIDPAVVTGIVFGAKCSAADRSAVRVLANAHEIEFFEATPDDKTFDLTIRASD